MKRADHCGCPKPTGCYGEHGWHWRPSAEWPEHRAQDVAIERCQAYERRVSGARSGRDERSAA